MNVDITFDCKNIDWNMISETLKQVGMAYYSPDEHQRAFEASFVTVFAWHAGRLVGFGRAISDGVYQAGVYDVAVIPDYQGKSIGSTIMKNILQKIVHCNIILYAATGKEGFYRKLGFRKMKTGLALFRNPDQMAKKGFTD